MEHDTQTDASAVTTGDTEPVSREVQYMHTQHAKTAAITGAHLAYFNAVAHWLHDRTTIEIMIDNFYRANNRRGGDNRSMSHSEARAAITGMVLALAQEISNIDELKANGAALMFLRPYFRDIPFAPVSQVTRSWYNFFRDPNNIAFSFLENLNFAEKR